MPNMSQSRIFAWHYDTVLLMIMTDYIDRELHQTVSRALKMIPVVVITGMRQTGKTTFLRHDGLFRDYRYETLDDFATLQTARNNPESLLATGDPLVVDEAQKAPELLIALKRAVDQNRIPGQFVLSGSANFTLLKSLSESLAGRAVYFTLLPFSQRELLGSSDNVPLLARLFESADVFDLPVGIPIDPAAVLKGGMPSVQSLSPADMALWFRGFEQTYVERDIRDFARIDDVLGFRTVMKLAALRSGQIVNVSQLARDARLSVPTLTRYMNLAETGFLTRRLPPFLRNRSTRLIKSPKLYLTDSGIAAHIAGVEGIHPEDDEPLRGALFETYVLQNISSILEAHLPDAAVAYWHIQGRHEVDFVIENRNSCVALELKAASRWSEKDLSSLRRFIEETPSCIAGVLMHNGNRVSRLGEKLWALPMGMVIS